MPSSRPGGAIGRSSWANEGLTSLLAEGADEWSAEEMDAEQMRGNDRCIDFIDKMLRIGRPLPLPVLPEEFEV